MPNSERNYKLKIKNISENNIILEDVVLDNILDKYIQPIGDSIQEDLECNDRICKIQFQLRDIAPKQSCKGYITIIYKIDGEDETKTVLIPLHITYKQGILVFIGYSSGTIITCIVISRYFRLDLLVRTHHPGQDIQDITAPGPGHPYGHSCRHCIIYRNRWIASHPNSPYYAIEEIKPIADYNADSVKIIVEENKFVLPPYATGTQIIAPFNESYYPTEEETHCIPNILETYDKIQFNGTTQQQFLPDHSGNQFDTNKKSQQFPSLYHTLSKI